MLGVVLFALPVGSMLSLAFSGALVSKYGSKRTVVNALLLYGLALPLIGLSANVWVLMASLVLFGAAGNLANIVMNTQAVHVEAKYGRSIMASFHGIWSLAGFTAAGFGTYMIAKSVVPLTHFAVITAVIVAGVAASFHYLLPDEGNKDSDKKRLFVKPDKALMRLGIIAFCCMVAEGAMFDWSGIYFQKVVRAEDGWVGAGYTAFMCAMASGRFVADWIANRWSFAKTVAVSGILIATGLILAVALPYVLSSIIGFLIVGFGVSSVVPLVYSQAGRSKTVAAGPALTAVSSIGFLGFLIGPPVIGVLAGAFSLCISFLVIAVIGLCIVGLVKSAKEAKD